VVSSVDAPEISSTIFSGMVLQAPGRVVGSALVLDAPLPVQTIAGESVCTLSFEEVAAKLHSCQDVRPLTLEFAPRAPSRKAATTQPLTLALTPTPTPRRLPPSRPRSQVSHK
jgi:hypothetical protein